MFQGDFYRRNLQFEAFQRVAAGSTYRALEGFVQELKKYIASGKLYSKPTIIYCNSKANVDDMQQYLQTQVSAAF
jgi:superfamily II DNA helicase RecQ